MSSLDKALEVLDRALPEGEPDQPLGQLPNDHEWQLAPDPLTGDLKLWVPLPKPVFTQKEPTEDEIKEYKFYRGIDG